MYILTRSGRQFHYDHPTVDSVHIDDVAHALAHVNRFTGHTRYAFSVAQHCVAVSHMLEAQGHPLDIVMAGLLHDAHEAYFGDVATPLKRFLGIADKEKLIQVVVLEALGSTLDLANAPAVKLADLTALAVERAHLMPQDQERWAILDVVTDALRQLMPEPRPMEPGEAKQTFLMRYRQLKQRLAATLATSEPHPCPGARNAAHCTSPHLLAEAV